MRWRGLILALCLVLALSSFADAVKIVQPAGGGAPSGPAGGDLGGTYPNPTVSSGAHLGAGTVPFTANSGWPGTFFYENFGYTASATVSWPTNVTMGNGITFKAPVTVSNLCMIVQTADGTGLYDWGIYNSSGVLVADVGPVHIGGTLLQCKPIVQGAVTLSGTMAVAITGNSAVAAIFRTSNGTCAWLNASMTGGGTSGGQLNASGLTIPSNNPVATCIQVAGY